MVWSLYLDDFRVFFTCDVIIHTAFLLKTSLLPNMILFPSKLVYLLKKKALEPITQVVSRSEYDPTNDEFLLHHWRRHLSKCCVCSNYCPQSWFKEQWKHVPWSRLSRFDGDGKPPTFNRNPYNWYIKPYYWVEFPIPYCMEIMGVDRPDRTHVVEPIDDK